MTDTHSTPLSVPAFLQALATCEKQAQVDKLEARYNEHKGMITPEDRRNVEDAIKRQRKVIYDAAARATSEG